MTRIVPSSWVSEEKNPEKVKNPSSDKGKVKKDKVKKYKRKKRKSEKDTVSSSKAASTSQSTQTIQEDEEGSTGGLKLLKRKCVTMTCIARRKALRQRKVVLFNKRGTPVGDMAQQMQSYIGVCTRRRVPISEEKWRSVSAETKDKIFQSVAGVFVLGHEHKRLVLASAGRKFREFKARLTAKYIIPYKDDPEALQFPPDDYRFINPDNWKAFVASRLTVKWAEKRKKQQERRKQNIYNHTMSRRGYAGLEEDLAKTNPDLEINRGTLWIVGRQDKVGNFKDDKVKEVADRINEYQHKVDSGDLAVSGTSYSLTMALNTPEHNGRVRGVGGFVTPTEFFGLPSRTETRQRNLRSTVTKIMESQREKMEAEMRERLISEMKLYFLSEKDNLSPQEMGKFLEKVDILETKLKGAQVQSGGEKASTQASCSKNFVGAGGNIPVGEVEKVPIREDNPPQGDETHSVQVQKVPKKKGKKRKACTISRLAKSTVPDEVIPEIVNDDDAEAGHKEDINSRPSLHHDTIMKEPPVEIQCKMAVTSLDRPVAIGTYMKNSECNVIHGKELRDDCLRISISFALDERAHIPIPVGDEIKTMKQAMGSWVAWPKALIIFEENEGLSDGEGMNEEMGIDKKEKGNDEEDDVIIVEDNVEEKVTPKRKRAKKDAVLDEQSETKYEFKSLERVLPPNMRMFAAWAEEGFKHDRVLQFDVEAEVFGQEYHSCVMNKDLHQICLVKEITARIIIVYQRYLYSIMAQTRMSDFVALVNPAWIGSGCMAQIPRSEHFVQRYTSGEEGRIFLLPYNSGSHWVLTVVDPDLETVYYMDPYKGRLATDEWTEVVNRSITMYNAKIRKNGRPSPLWKNLAGMPKQPDAIQCGYYVMLYMKEIINNKDDCREFVKRWGRRPEKRGGNVYTREDIDTLREEWAKFLIQSYVFLP